MRILKTMLVYILLGPPVGWLAFASFIIVDESMKSPAPFGTQLMKAADFMLIILVGLPFSYWIGFGPALATGIAIALVQDRGPNFDFLAVTVIGVVCGLLFALAFDRTNSSPAYFVAKVLTCLVPTLICWALARRWRRTFELKE